MCLASYGWLRTYPADQRVGPPFESIVSSVAPRNSDPEVGLPAYRGFHGATRLLRAEALAADSYGLLLALLIVDYVILSVGLPGAWAPLVTTACVGLTALLAFRTSLVRGPMLRAVQLAVAVAAAVAIVVAIEPSSRGKGVLFAILSLLVLASPIAVVSRIIRHTRVTLETLLGSICVYVLIGLVFTCADIAVQFVSGTSYFAQPGDHGPPDFIYFSFITMTTVGYGDLSPAHGLPRTMAVLEALAGQIFLVVMVSRLVALFTPMQRSVRLAMRQARARGMDPQEEAPADGDSAAVGPDAGRERTGPIAHMDDDDGLEP
jgi:Ion channel